MTSVVVWIFLYSAIVGLNLLCTCRCRYMYMYPFAKLLLIKHCGQSPVHNNYDGGPCVMSIYVFLHNASDTGIEFEHCIVLRTQCLNRL